MYRGRKWGIRACGPAARFAGLYRCCQGLVASRSLQDHCLLRPKSLRRRCALEPGRAAGKGGINEPRAAIMIGVNCLRHQRCGPGRLGSADAGGLPAAGARPPLSPICLPSSGCLLPPERCWDTESLPGEAQGCRGSAGAGGGGGPLLRRRPRGGGRPSAPP